MRQILIKDGSVIVADIPAPMVGAKNILVRVAYSCISSGTEIVSVRNSGLPLYRRALRQPENVAKVLRMLREEGIQRTYDRVRGRLASGTPTGYSAAGSVIAVGAEVEGFAVGEKVACAGAGVANHAEVIDVPVNLAVRVPGDMDLRDAATVTLGAIALQGIRRTQPTLGETVLVVGLGLLGQLTVQLLHAQGCRVIAIDPDDKRRDMARLQGASVLPTTADDYIEQVFRLTDGNGADAAIITAASRDDDIVSRAFRSCRRKGRVVIVGDVGLNLRRSDFYAKELDLLISTSYGPGRYDPYYEEGGQDYPLGYVRWTENRNMEAYLQLLAQRRVRLEMLEPRSYTLADAAAAYASIGAQGSNSLLTFIEYPKQTVHPERKVVLPMRSRSRANRIRVACVGAGSFAQATHLPTLQKLKSDFELRTVVSRTGTTALAVAQHYGAAVAATDYDAVLSDPDIDLVIVTTRHNLHASFALKALQAGKHVFVEKPLALNIAELDMIEQFYAGGRNDQRPLLMTGFNRRFSPALVAARKALEQRVGPMIIDYRMNAGYAPSSHWVHGPEGGGRNIGEACHIYDVFQFLTASTWLDVNVSRIATTSRYYRTDDNFVATMSYADGSVCTLTYTALGARSYPKERMEIFFDGTVASLDDYKSLTVSDGRARGWSAETSRKGQLEEMQALAGALRQGLPWPISLDDQLATTRLSFAIQTALNPSGQSDRTAGQTEPRN